MKRFQLLSLINGLFLSANAVAAVVFSPYVDFTLNTRWDPEIQSMAPMDLVLPVQTQGIKAYHLAFITDSGECQPAWGGQQDYSVDKEWGKQQTDLLASNGVQLTVSFGGASNNDISQKCTESQLVATFNQVIKNYHAQSLDFDIENGTANVPKLLKALKIIQQQPDKVALSFTLPVMPEGLTAEGKGIIEDAEKAGLKFNINIMAMDYGPAYSGDMGAYAIQAATSLHQWLQELYPQDAPADLWHRIEVTPMIGVNDVSIEQFTLKNADQLKEFAQEHFLGALSMWSFTRDKACADKWASPLCSGNNLQTHDYEFLQHFQ